MYKSRHIFCNKFLYKVRIFFLQRFKLKSQLTLNTFIQYLVITLNIILKTNYNIDNIFDNLDKFIDILDDKLFVSHDKNVIILRNKIYIISELFIYDIYVCALYAA